MKMSRNLKNQRKRAAAVMGSKIEMLAAAYLKETNIPADRVRLCQEVVGNTLHVWFEELKDVDNADPTAEGTNQPSDQLVNGVPG